MWKALVGNDAILKPTSSTLDDDCWETEADFINDVDEKNSRWGAKTINQSGHQGSVSLDILRSDVLRSDSDLKQKQMDHMPKASLGYGGKFGLQTDRIDKVAETWEYKGKTEKHASQKDYSQGFGGKFGVQQDRQDKSAVGWEYKDNLAKHDSQKDYSVGFGGKFGVQKDRQDKSAASWEYKEKLQTHESQRDYAVGFGGKYGVQTDHQDKSAVGWEYKENLQIHESQKDYSKGFGGKYGVEKEKQDKSAVGWDYKGDVPLHDSQKDHAVGFGGKFGVQSDRKDKSAVGYDYQENLSKHESQTHSKESISVAKKPVVLPKSNVRDEYLNIEKKVDISLEIEKGRATDLKSKFEQLTMKTPETEKVKAQEARDSRRALMIKENIEPTGIRPGRPEQLNLAERITDENAENGEIKTCTDSVLKSPVSPSKLSSSKVAHELMGRFINHPEMKNRHSDDEWSTDRTIDAHESLTKIESTSGNEKSREYHLTLNGRIDDTLIVSTTDAEQNGNEQNVIHYQEDNVNYNINNNKTCAKGGGFTEEEQEVKNHPLAPPAHPMADTNVRAVALYDYEAAADDEISFEPDDIITNIEMVDPGWWRGQSKSAYGLFPANYVELMPS